MITFINEKHNTKAVVRAKLGDTLTDRQIRRVQHSLCPDRIKHEVHCLCSSEQGRVYGGDLKITEENKVIERFIKQEN